MIASSDQKLFFTCGFPHFGFPSNIAPVCTHAHATSTERARVRAPYSARLRVLAHVAVYMRDHIVHVEMIASCDQKPEFDIGCSPLGFRLAIVPVCIQTIVRVAQPTHATSTGRARAGVDGDGVDGDDSTRQASAHLSL